MSVAWPPDKRADVLLPQRASLLRRLHKVVPAATALSDDDRELVVDEALTYAVMEHEVSIDTAEDVENVFWTAAQLRVARMMEGRYATVRGGFGRTSDEELERMAGSDDPADLVERTI